MIDMIRYIMIYDISRYVVVNCMYSMNLHMVDIMIDYNIL